MDRVFKRPGAIAGEFHGRDAATRVRDYCAGRPGEVPCTVVARCGGQLAGSVALVEDDMDGARPALTPWLATLFVHPVMRQRGIAPQLMAAAERAAAQSGHAMLHLWTPHEELVGGLYCKLGWEVVEAFEDGFDDYPRAWVMRKGLC